MSAYAHRRLSQSPRWGLFCCVRFVVFLFAGLAEDSSLAGERADMLNVYGSEQAISIATGYDKPIARAPAVASVITDEEIRAIGATTLDEVIETVAGVHLSTSRQQGVVDVQVRPL